MTSKNPVNESISALVDDESNELDLQRVLKAVDADGDVADTWSRYHLIGTVLRKEPVKFDYKRLATQVGQSVSEEVVEGPSKYKKALASWRANLGRGAVAATVALGFIIGFETLGTLDSQAPSQSSSEVAVADAPTLQPQLQQQATAKIPSGFELPVLNARTVSAGNSAATQAKSREQVLLLPVRDFAGRNQVKLEQSAELQAVLNAYMHSHAQQTSSTGAFGVLPMARVSQADTFPGDTSQPSNSQEGAEQE